jgi:hypothetical protein
MFCICSIFRDIREISHIPSSALSGLWRNTNRIAKREMKYADFRFKAIIK